jgi:hypothetical protein
MYLPYSFEDGVFISPSSALQYDQYMVLSSKGFLNLHHEKASGIDTSVIHIRSIKSAEL